MPSKVVGIIQSNYLPWIGYFDFIDSCDLFIIFDDTQYSKGTWRNRNKVKTPAGVKWLTVPVSFRLAEKTNIDQTPINYSENWVNHHRSLLRQSYESAPYFAALAPPIFAILEQPYNSISDLNIALLSHLLPVLGISTPLVRSSELGPSGHRTDRLIDLLKKVGASEYLSGPAAKAYLEPGKFEEAGIGLSYKSYSYAPYPQLFGEFEAGLSIVDLLFNCGPNSKSYCKTALADEVVVRTPV